MCSTAIADGAVRDCARCGLELAGPAAQELRLINAELDMLVGRQRALVSRRSQILAELSSERAAARKAGGRQDASGRGAAHVLLAAGGVMFGLAVLAFTVASWARLGPGGRAAILLTVTAAVLAVPAALARRQLRATAEAVAAVGLVLSLADAYLIYRLLAPVPGNGKGYAAMASAALAVAWMAYGRATRLTSPVLGAIMIAQFPLVLAALATSSLPEPAGLALLGTSICDCVFVIARSEAGAPDARLQAQRVTAIALLALTGVAGLLIGLAAWFNSAAWPQAGPGWSRATWVAVVIAAAAVAAALAVRAIWSRWERWGIAVAGGLATVSAGIALASALPRPWSAAAFGAASATAVAAVALVARNGRLSPVVPVAFGAAVTLGLAMPAELISAAHGGAVVPWLPVTLVIAAAVAAAGAVAGTVWRGRLSGLGALLAVLPLVLAAAITSRPAGPTLGLGPGRHLGVPATLAILTFVCAALTWAIALAGPAPAEPGRPAPGRPAPGRPAPGGAPLASAALGSWSLTIALALGSRTQLLAVLALAVVMAAGCAWRASHPWIRAGGAFGAARGLGAFVQVLAELAGLRPWLVVLAVLAVAALAQLAAWRIARGPVAVGAEAAGWLMTAIGVVAAAWIGTANESAPILLAAAVLCLAVSARPGRRLTLGLGLLLGVAALLTWLAGPARPAPEPWTLPAAAVVLCVGWLAGRRAPAMRSWQALGPGLAIALVPSLAAAWTSHGALRPLLLGLAAAALAVAGARARLQAPVVLGALVAVLDGGRQIAPVVARLAGALPNWVPVAAIGAVLLWAGATYEARLRDMRKIGHAVAGLR